MATPERSWAWVLLGSAAALALSLACSASTTVGAPVSCAPPGAPGGGAPLAGGPAGSPGSRLPPPLSAVAPSVRLPRIVRQLGHTDLTIGIRYSRGGKFILSNSVDRTIKVWDAETGLLIGTADGFSSQVDSAELLATDRQALVTTIDGELLLVDLETGERTVLERGSQGSARVIRVAQDGRQAIVGAAGRPTLWDLGQRKVVARLDLGREVVEGAGFTPSGPVVVIQRRGQLTVTNLLTKRVVFRQPHEDGIADVSITRDGSHLVVGNHKPYNIEVYDTTTWQKVADLPGQRYEIQAAELSPDGRMLATCGRDGSFNLWDLRTASLIHKENLSARGTQWDLTSLDFSPDGRHLAVAVGTTRVGSSKILVFDVADRRIAREFSGAEQLLSAAKLLPGGGMALTAARNGEVVLWDVNTASRLSRFSFADLSGVAGTKGYSFYEIEDAEVSGDGRILAAAATGGSLVAADPRTPHVLDLSGHTLVRVVDTQSGGTRILKAGGSARVHDLALSHDGRVAAVAVWPGVRLAHSRIYVWDVPSGRLVRTIESKPRPNEGFFDPIHGVALSADGRILYAAGDDGVVAHDVTSGATVRTFDAGQGHRQITLSPDGRFAVTAGKKLAVWDLATGTGRPLGESPYRSGYVALALAPGATHLYGAGGTAAIDVWNVATSAVERKLAFPFGTIDTLDVSTDGRRLIATSRDGSARLVDVATGQSMSFTASGDDWLVYSDDTYFDASRNGGKLVAVADGLTSYRIDQLAARSNRPDLLLGRIPGTDPGAAAHFYASYRRRLERLGLTEAELDQGFAAAPKVEIVGVSPAGTRATLDVVVKSAASPLRSLQIYASGVPVLGASGLAVSGTEARLPVTVELTQGENRLEASATNQRGVESLRVLRTVQGVATRRPRLYALAFGVSRYARPGMDLRYAHKDALDLVDLARSLEGKTFERVVARAFVNEEVTVANLRAARGLLADAGPEDTLVVFVAGHGLYSGDAAAEYHYLTHEADPSRLRETAAPFSLVEDLVRDVRPRKKLLLVDTCASGDRSPAEASAMTIAAGSRGLAARSIRALEAPGGVPLSSPPRPYLLRRDRFIYNDLLRRTGAIVLSSSRGTELSFETEEAQNGLFTEEVLRALTTTVADKDRNGLVTDGELRDHVAVAVARASGDAQHPVVDIDNPDVDVALPIASEAAGILTRGDPLPPGAPRAARALVLETGSPLPPTCPERVPPPHACGCRTASRSSGGPGLAGVLVALVALAVRRRRSALSAARPWPVGGAS